MHWKSLAIRTGDGCHILPRLHCIFHFREDVAVGEITQWAIRRVIVVRVESSLREKAAESSVIGVCATTEPKNLGAEDVAYHGAKILNHDRRRSERLCGGKC